MNQLSIRDYIYYHSISLSCRTFLIAVVYQLQHSNTAITIIIIIVIMIKELFAVSINTTSAEKTLASAISILENNDIALELLPPKSDTEGWKEITATLGLSFAQTLALKKHTDVQTQVLTAQTATRAPSREMPKPPKPPEATEEDFSLSSASALKDCLQLLPDATVIESLVGPGHCLSNMLPTSAGITHQQILDIVNFHREAIRAIAVKPDIDVELLVVIRLYTIQSPIPFYHYVNKVLNSPDRTGLENIAPFMRLLIRALHAMEDTGYGFTGQAYRGVKIGDCTALQAKYDNHEIVFRPESLITFASFTSVTRESRQVQNFGEEYGHSIFFHFLSVRGIDVSSVSMYPEEAEILVIPPAVFRVGGSCKLYRKLTVPLTQVEQEGASYLRRAATAVVPVSREVRLLSGSDATVPSPVSILQILSDHYNMVMRGSRSDWHSLKEHATKAVPLACALVAICYSKENICIVPNDANEASSWASRSLTWLRDEADRGCKYAQFALAELFMCCRSMIKSDKSEAIKLYRLAADQRLASAQCRLGYCYDGGIGVTKDKREAARLYRLAADQGDVNALWNLAVSYKQSSGMATDQRESVRLFKLAADRGYAGAQLYLGMRCEDGVGVTQNDTEALRWYRLAADQGSAAAQYRLGHCYRQGVIVSMDENEAARWFRLAADGGDPNAQCCLGRCYEHGTGVTKDRVEAVRWYQLAADQGDEFSQKALAKIRIFLSSAYI
jgi:TPR repeat protein